MKNRRDHEFDLSTALVIGAAVGLAATFLLRRRHRGQSIMMDLESGMHEARRTGRTIAKKARRTMHRGAEFVDDRSLGDLGDQIHDYVEAAKGAIVDTVSGELRDLRKAMRRRRRRLGV